LRDARQKGPAGLARARCRRFRCAAALALVLPFSWPAATAFDPAEYGKAAATILCDCGCHPQAVADCTCGRAAEMRAEVRGMIESGMSGEAVIAAYVERYGDKIRIAPTATGFNLLAWLGPLVALVAGLVGVVWLVRRLSRRAADVAPVDAAPPPAGDDAYLARLRREVEERL